MPDSFKFRQKLKEGRPLIGTIQTLESTEITEILVSAGFDWLFVDLEHSPLGPREAQRILQAAGDRCPCIVRVPCHEETWIKKILDIGSAGILFPKVNFASQASRIIDLCKYPPQGHRGIGLARAQGYGLNFDRYIETANTDVAVIMQIEDIEAVKNIDSIVNVPGIDVLFIGPYDLSASMGKPGQVNDPEVLEKIEIVRNSCLKAGIAAGIFTSSPADVEGFIENGYTVITVGIDTATIAKSATETLKTVKSTIDSLS